MKASVDLNTGLLIESQSHADDTTLIGNAAATGFANVEIRSVTEAELDTLVATRKSARMTQADKLKAIECAIEQHMDAMAQTRTWDNRWSCTARTGYANPWQIEAIKFAQWMDACWQYTIQEQQKVIAGTRPMPTTEQAIAELPVIVW